MPIVIPDLTLPARGKNWKWWVCGLLLLATMINYMDRLTLNQMAGPIMTEFGLQPRDYGQLESAFGAAFALGAILMGVLADRRNVRGLYPAAVLLWSLAGFLTGLAGGFLSLLVCRVLLGLAESGNWPCALRTTQRILPPSERTMGNGLLQSGAAVGAVLTPLIVLGLFRWTGTWRYSFMVIGLLGLVWVAAWLVSVRREDLELAEKNTDHTLLTVLGFLVLVLLYGIDVGIHLAFVEVPSIPLLGKFIITLLGVGGVAYWLARVTRDEAGAGRAVFFRRFFVLAVIVVAINATWHFFRAWLPLFLQNQHGYSLEAFSWFSMAYYLATDVGSLTAGFVTLRLARGGMPVHASRVLVFSACAVLTTFSVAAALLQAGWLLLGVLLVIGFASLGLFPNYYSFSQELSVRHQGKVTGALGCICWMSMSLLHEVVGDVVQRTGSYSFGVGCAGFLPLIGLAVLVLFWGRIPIRSVEEGSEMPIHPPHRDAIIPAPAEGITTIA
jgi:ACS family hexuronate transporter-like MFS transporter